MHENNSKAMLKLCYLIALTIALFFTNSFLLLVVVLITQIVLLLKSGLGFESIIRVSKKLLLMFLVIIISYYYFPPSEHSGFAIGLTMCFKILTMVLASFWVQKTEKADNLILAMRRLYMPEILALSIQTSLSLLAGEENKKNSGQGGGKGNALGKSKIKITFADIKQKRLNWVHDKIIDSLVKAKESIKKANPSLSDKQIHDLSIIVGMVLAIMSLKLLQLLPSLPIAPGHKNLFIIPMLLLASSLTNTRWGGLLVGTTAGLVSVMMGYGKYGFFEVAHMAIPGLLADILLPIIRNQKIVIVKFIAALIVGAIIGAARFAANFLVIVLAGAPFSAFIIYTPMLFSQIAFGALSSLVTVAILNRIQDYKNKI